MGETSIVVGPSAINVDLTGCIFYQRRVPRNGRRVDGTVIRPSNW